MTGFRTVEEHRADVLAACRPAGTERVAIDVAHGRTLRADIRAAVDIPVFDNSAMDGFAVRFADVASASEAQPVTLRVIADLPAGTDLDPELAPGEAARIMTGAPVPASADAIVPFEDTVDGLADSLTSTTVVTAPARPGVHIRRAAEDLCAGNTVLEAGRVLTAFACAGAAAAGVDAVDVSRRPRVAVVSTGSELVPPGGPLRRGQIPESNSVLLAAMATDAGADVVARLSVDDEGPSLHSALAEIIDDADVVVFSGGVSAGAYEVVRNELAATMAFHRVTMQPGKPQGFGVASIGALLFGLPGNPVSAAVSFEVFVRPALLALQGRTLLDRPTLRLPADTGWRSPARRRQYVPSVIVPRADGLSVRPATSGGSGSHLAGGLGRAHAFAIVPEDVTAVDADDVLTVMLLEGWAA
jgi:molybdopterin molybdotransferase